MRYSQLYQTILPFALLSSAADVFERVDLEVGTLHAYDRRPIHHTTGGNSSHEGFRIEARADVPRGLETELKEVWEELMKGVTISYPLPTTPKPAQALSIVMQSSFSFGFFSGARSDSKWLFFNTKVGHSVSCDYKSHSQVKEIVPGGPTNPGLGNKVPQDGPWPVGEFKLKIDGQDCQYKMRWDKSRSTFLPR